MKKIFYIALVVALGIGCEHVTNEVEQGAPEPSRFSKEVFVSNLYEPTELVILPKNKILFTERRGSIKQYDLRTDELSDYDSISVYSGKEDGLMGIALDPDFEQNSWVYLYYSPVGDEPVQYLSRFSFTPNGLTNEVLILEVPVQRDECCHTGGSVQFGGDGLLYLSTGDDTNPFNSNGFSPSDERPGRSAWDAQGTSANTNDLRGKILRIKPEPDGSYSIPEGNLFVDDDPLTRPEIYVMGCRNPYRISVDSKRGWLFWGDVGPDAANDVDGRGPRGYDEFNVATKPGFFGWPLFVGDNFAYNKYDFKSGTSGPKHNPAKPINNSPNNTGLTTLPPTNPAKVYYPYAKFETFPQLKSGGRNAMAGPVYYSDQYDAHGEFPSYFDGRVIYYDWMRGFIYFLELDEEGNPIDWYQFMPDTEFNNVIDMEFGPDGQLYMIEYGTGWFTRNEDARLSRINYIKGNRPPVVKATLSKSKGATPLEVTMDASKSLDHDKDNLTFQWTIGNETFTDSVLTYTFVKEGIYYPELVVSDGRNKIRQQFVVEAGNEPPVVKIDITGNESFYWDNRVINYAVKVSDLEDEQQPAGIDQNAITFDIGHYQSTDMAEVLGHQSPVSDGLSLIESLDCKACHKIDGESIGPSYTKVAERYRSEKGAVSYLAKKIISGGGGVWGEQAMSAHPDLSEADATKIVDYILSLGKSSFYPLAGSYQVKEKTGRYLLSASYEDMGKSPLKPIKQDELVWLSYNRIKADAFDESNEVQARNGVISSIFDQSWVMFSDTDLTDIAQIKLQVWKSIGGEIAVRLGSPDGKEIGKVLVDNSSKRSEPVINLEPTVGREDVYLVFSKKNEKNPLMGIRYIEFVPNPNAL